MVSITRWNEHTNILVTCINKRATFFLFAVYDLLTEKHANNYPRCKCALSFSADWLEFLIHIHRNRKVLRILPVRWWVTTCRPALANFTSEGRKCLMLKGLNVGERSHSISTQGKRFFWKTVALFYSESHSSIKMLPKRVNTRKRCLLWASRGVASLSENRTWRRYLKIHVRYFKSSQFEWYSNKN